MTSTALRVPDSPTVPGRRRSFAALFSAVALMNAAMIGASATSTLIAAEAVGAGWSGAPNAAGVLGTAAGAATLGILMARRGRRAGLLVGYTIASLGAGLAVVAVLSSSLPLLLAAMLLFGVGNGGAQLSRYAAADLYPPERRGFALGSLVWAGTVGAVVGPNLLSPAATAASAFDIPRFAGVFLLAVLAAVGAGVTIAVMPRNPSPSPLQTDGGVATPFRDLLTSPNVKVALTAMLTSQLVMVAVMTMTPVHIDHEGHGLDTVGLVLSAHTLGMFALSPISGRLTDRFGSRTIIMAGLGTLAASAVVAIAAPTADGVVLAFALFLLGYGWNLNLVGGSRLLSGDLPAAAQARVQGIVEALVWGASAFASLISGVIFTIGGYSVLAVAAGALIAIPAVVLARERRLALS